jgi:hypothetical protein
VSLKLCERDYYIDSDEVLEYFLNKDGTSKKYHLFIREIDDDDSDDIDDSSPSIRNTSQKRRNIRPDSMLKIVDETSLQSSALKSNGIQCIRKHPDSRGTL